MPIAYYNEHNPYAAQWLRNLITRGAIAPGDVDERSIDDVTPGDLAGYTQCHFFAGVAGWSHALRLAGWTDDRQVWTGSCPCQPFSAAGAGGGFTDERHLWPAFFHLIQECKPRIVFGEQVEAAIKHGWVDLVQTDLENCGYAFAATGLCAAGVGAPHRRQRLYWVGDSQRTGLEGYARDGSVGDRPGRQPAPASGSDAAPSGAVGGFWADAEWLDFLDGKKRPVQPGLGPMAPRTVNHVGRLRAYGNAIVAPLAAEFIAAFMGASA